MDRVNQAIQAVAQAPATGMTIGGSTFVYSILVEVTTVAQAVGIIMGAMLSTGLFVEFVIRKLRERRDSES